MSHYFEIDWEVSWPPLYGQSITIDTNTILWRSYDKSYPAIGDRFAYYSSKQVASGYKKNNTRELGHFVSTRQLKLVDYRFMRVLLSRLISTNSHDKAIQSLASIMLSFGLCSLGHQIELIKMRYKDLNKSTHEYKQIQESINAMEKYYKPSNIIEQTGVRVAETTNDVYTMGFLQELFKDIFDGFISPRLYSPFHTEKPDTLMSPEIVIFNPKLSGVEELIKYPSPSMVTKIKINDILHRSSSYVLIDNANKTGSDMRLDFFMCGGSRDEGHYLDIADELLNSNDDELSKLYNYGKKVGSEWKKKIVLQITEAPSPCVPVSMFRNFEIG